MAHLGVSPETPPQGSPFPDLRVARQFAGPLPFTFDYEEASGALVIIEGIRRNWDPRPITVDVGRCTFLHRFLPDTPPRLANAFFIEDIPYRWKRGVLERLAEGAA